MTGTTEDTDEVLLVVSRTLVASGMRSDTVIEPSSTIDMKIASTVVVGPSSNWDVRTSSGMIVVMKSSVVETISIADDGIPCVDTSVVRCIVGVTSDGRTAMEDISVKEVGPMPGIVVEAISTRDDRKISSLATVVGNTPTGDVETVSKSDMEAISETIAERVSTAAVLVA